MQTKKENWGISNLHFKHEKFVETYDPIASYSEKRFEGWTSEKNESRKFKEVAYP